MEQLNTLKYLKLIFAHKKQIIISTSIACLLSIIAVSPIFITPLYQSNAIVYPTNLVPFSNESNTEQLIQFFSSSHIENLIISKFNLYYRYEIQKESSGANTKLIKLYRKHIQVKRTNFEAVEISVLDENPDTAKQMCSTIIKETNNFIKISKLKPVAEYISGIQHQAEQLKQKIDSINSKIEFISKNYGIIDVKNQSKLFQKTSLTTEEKTILLNLKEHGPEFELLKNQLEAEIKNYRKIQEQLNKQLIDYNSTLSYFTIVSEPSTPDDKSYPNRLFICFIFTLSTFILSVFLTVIIHEYKTQNA